ncbi:MAG: methyltransferase domain-containing protein [Patescibacteria group bacterium]
MKIKNFLKNLFQFGWQPTKDTVIAFILGCLVVVASLGLFLFSGSTPADRIGFFVLKDIIMMFALGLVTPLYYVLVIRKEGLGLFGITRKKWLVSSIVGIVLAVMMFFQFVSMTEKPWQEILLSSKAIGPIFYIMVAGIFEVLFLFGFLRRKFEDAFGIIPSIILAALFYSFHHVGFQPEFVKLFFVGILFASVFRITNNILIIYPFFWGTGACWDVLVQSEVIAYQSLQDAWIKGIIILALIIVFAGYLKWKLNMILKNEEEMTERQELWDKEKAQKHAKWMKMGSRWFYAPFARKIIECLFPSERDLTILDLGTGPGLLSIEIDKLLPQAKIIGVDPSGEMLKIARKNADEVGMSNYETRLGRAEKMPIDSNSVDLVVSQSSLHEWENPQEGFLEIFRVLKPGGSLILKDYNRDWLSTWKRTLFKFFHHLEMFKFTFDEVVNLLREAGFDEIKGKGKGKGKGLELFVQALKR